MPRRPTPKWVVAVRRLRAGRRLLCRKLRGCRAASAAVVPVDLHIPGCPPSPTALLQGLLALLERRAPGAP